MYYLIECIYTIDHADQNPKLQYKNLLDLLPSNSQQC